MAYYGDDNDNAITNNPNLTQYGGDGNDALGITGVQDLIAYGGNGNDTLYNSSTSNYIYAFGGLGNDYLQVVNRTNAASPSFLYGEDGNDVIWNRGFIASYIDGGIGDDALYGGTGNDTIYGGEGDDSSAIMVTAGTGAGGFTVTLAGGLYGGAGNDYLDGGRGNDILYGGENNDTMYGGEGNDTLIGQTGADIMFGGAGNDIYDVDDVSDYVGETQSTPGGTDTVYTSVTYALTLGVENLVLQGTVRDGGGNDLDNNITGNASNNVITGAAGYDVLTGGGGNDVFVFLRGAGVDFITDFVGGAGASDTIYVSNTLFSSYADILAHASQSGADTVINDGVGDTLVLRNVTIGSLLADDFVLY